MNEGKRPSGTPSLPAPSPEGVDELVGGLVLRPEVAEQVLEVLDGMDALLSRQALQVCGRLREEGSARHLSRRHPLLEPGLRGVCSGLTLLEQAAEVGPRRLRSLVA